MAKQTKRLLALFIASVMCFSLCVPSLAEDTEVKDEPLFYDFNTDDPTSYFASIPGWNLSTTKSAFTIHSWEKDSPDEQEWGNSLKYINGAGNEQARVEVGSKAYDSVGIEFSVRIDSASNNMYVDFRNEKDIYAVVFDTNKRVNFFSTTIANYELEKWYDVKCELSVANKYACLWFKEHSSDTWDVYNQFGIEKITGTEIQRMMFEIHGGADNDGGVKYIDNLKVYPIADGLKPSLSIYNDDFEDGINHASSVTDYSKMWKSMNTNSQTEITAEPLEGYEGKVLKLKDVSSSTAQVNLTVGKYPFSDANAPDVRHLMTYKMGSSFNGGIACVYMKYVSPQRNSKSEVNLLTLKENQVIMEDKDGYHTFDAKIEPGKLYDVTYLYDAKSKVAVLSVVDGNGDTISKFLDLGLFDSEYGYVYNIEFANGSVGENTVYVDDFSWDINSVEFELSDCYVKSGNSDDSDLDETVVFEYTDMVEENIEPVVTVKKDGAEVDTAYIVTGKGNAVQVAFDELERNSSYEVSLSGINSVFGDSSSKNTVSFVTSDYAVDVETISVSDGVITANLKGAFKNGTEAYIAASAYDSDDNITEVKLLPIEVPYRDASAVTFTPEFEGDYSYIKAVVIRNFASAIFYSANVPTDGGEIEDGTQDEEYEAITSIEIDEDTFTVCGENISKDSSVIGIQVLKSGKTWTDLSGFDYENGDITEILAGFDSVADVEYGEGYSFTQKLSGGDMPAFRVRFGDGIITYYDPVLMENINNAQTADELSEIVKADSAVWDEMCAVVENLEDDEEALFWQILLDTKDNLKDEGKALSLPSEVTELAPGVSALARLKTSGKDELKNLFDTLADEGIFETNSYEIYAGVGDFEGFGMSASQKDSFTAHIQKNVRDYEYIEDFVRDFDENAVFYAIKDGSKQRINKILTTSDLLDSDEFPTYETLNATKRNTVCSELGTSKLFTSIESLEDAVESESKAAKKIKEENGGGVGSGAGGGAGGGSYSNNKGQPVVSVGEEDKEEVKVLSFDDIKNVEWAQKAINALAEKKIVSGDGKGSFRPSDFVTREEFVKMLVLTLNISTSSADENFDDITSSDWCRPYVAAAISKGIVNGIDENNFGKGRIITREEMATMTYRALSAMGIMLGGAHKDEFADIGSISDWAKEACVKMQEAGIINGMGQNHFAPKENVTRAQAAKILYEVLSR